MRGFQIVYNSSDEEEVFRKACCYYARLVWFYTVHAVHLVVVLIWEFGDFSFDCQI